jgi:hypothetical protein
VTFCVTVLLSFGKIKLNQIILSIAAGLQRWRDSAAGCQTCSWIAKQAFDLAAQVIQ